MSSSIAIPKRKQPRHGNYEGNSVASSASSSTTPTSPFSPSSSLNYNSRGSASPTQPSVTMSKATSLPTTSPMHNTYDRRADRRPSLLGTSLSHCEYTVINVAGPDGPPRLVTCVKSSQGFDWNQDIFLPSYIDYDSSDLERKPDPVKDIILTDEEAAALLPQ
ncbi:hypothetical protein K461DRAFT_310026 [Myriangium duriaei CBS 260.36]|uniref:Uncharacterized protein n=1 Tax=Myriangium duriaei CBS 260.36 TaxID=1168546 RepID=A0A9P4MQ94_9PEZI|nr:hypothetical protein K461DRAFT_310026 [Myriangium duriaei CBS 260.36]